MANLTFERNLVLYLVAGLFSGGGHSYVAAMCLFPFALATVMATDNLFLYSIMLFAQLPFYAVTVQTARHGKQRENRIIILTLIHIAVITLCLLIKYLVNEGRGV